GTFVAGGGTVTYDFDPGSGQQTLSSISGGINSFILKLDELGSFVWVERIGRERTKVEAFSINNAGDIVVTGSFRDTTDFDPGSGVYHLIGNEAANRADIFVAKYNTSGNFLWA